MQEQGSDQATGAFDVAPGKGTQAKTADSGNSNEPSKDVSRSASGTSRSGRSHSNSSGSAASGKKKIWIKGAPIASGSFGSVYFGMNTRTGVIMAVKEVELPTPGSVSMTRNQRMVDALKHELDLLKGLDHKNVVKYLGTDMDDHNLYIFLEYVSGGSVSSALASFGMFPESLVRTYTAQILEGLLYLHEQGIIHRDIKGGNVLIDQDGSVKISDFGISKRVDEVVAASKKDRRASLQGSVFWMAPEVVKDTHYTFKGDVWSLGCLVIEMMTGTHPFPDLDQLQALYSIGQRGRPKIPGGISAAGEDFLDQALQVDLDKRPTATDLLQHAFVSDIAPPSP
ncbi:kinase-like domain-containing protein [Coemansia spiralis]|nr:kinase-like domain-containing protein [Coemansia spiralis]